MNVGNRTPNGVHGRDANRIVAISLFTNTEVEGVKGKFECLSLGKGLLKIVMILIG